MPTSWQDASILVGSLKGAAASIYLLLALTRGTRVVWEVDDLCHATKYKRDAVMAGRQELISKGLATTLGARFGLMLTDIAVQQLQLPFKDLSGFSGMAHAGQPDQTQPAGFPGMAQAGQPNQTGSRSDETGEVDLIDLEVEKIDLSKAGSVVVVDLNRSALLEDQQQQQTNKDGGRSKKSTSSEADETRRRGVLRACAEVGIRYPKKRELAELPWCTGDRVLRMVREAYLEKRGGVFAWDNPEGEAISRLFDEYDEPKTTEELDAWEAECQRVEAARQAERAARQTYTHTAPVERPKPVDSKSVQQVWQAMLGELSLQMTKPTFETWSRPSVVVAYDPGQNEFTVAVETDSLKDWIERNLRSSCIRSLNGIIGRPAALTFVTYAEWAKST